MMTIILRLSIPDLLYTLLVLQFKLDSLTAKCRTGWIGCPATWWCHAAEFGWCPLLECHTVTLTIWDNAQDLDAKWILHVAKFRRGKSPRKCIYSVPAKEMAKHCVKFVWPPLSDVGIVTKPRHKTHWNLLGFRKLANRSQPLVSKVHHIVMAYGGDIAIYQIFFRWLIHALVAKI